MGLPRLRQVELSKQMAPQRWSARGPAQEVEAPMQEAPYKDCGTCGERFTKPYKYSRTQWLEARYCSNECRDDARRVVQPTKRCVRCGDPFMRPQNYSNELWERRRFCSKRCHYLVDPVPTPPLTHEVAWAAGLYEGEGTCGLFGTRVVTAVVIHMTDREPIERCCAALGLGYVEGPRRVGYANRKPLYIWRINKAAEIVAFFDAVWPFISERRKGQARPLIAHCKERISPYAEAA